MFTPSQLESKFKDVMRDASAISWHFVDGAPTLRHFDKHRMLDAALKQTELDISWKIFKATCRSMNL